MAAYLEPEEQGSGVADIEIVVRSVCTDPTVVQIQDRIDLFESEMVEGLVPPDVIGEVVGVAPVRLVGDDPLDAFAVSPLHLEDMSDGVAGPDVVGIPLDRFPAKRLGGR